MALFNQSTNDDLNSGGTRRTGTRIPGPTQPKGEVIGDLWYDTNVLILKVWNGSAFASVKTFVIDHPLEEDKHLVHACIEGPEAAVFYRGKGQLVDGEVEIQLPDYFESLCAEEGRSVQLTCIAESLKDRCPVLQASYPKNGKFWVGLGSEPPIKDQQFWWEVTAVRKDVSPVDVEPLKSSVEVIGNGPYTYIR